ncbi:hypothetical protein EMA8858_02305 [Emticicia aquatica]|uniref:Thoeris protein ThsB TIR-like domain-containing protein n=1 Tax=Emticicia aquatica TaxID=1681835 RepID=A0ABM9ARN1_9BACT|nr:TIR domain-containing protein [Emticicia aquatica]CAH0996175.1 hypothetical protein EMA8858_02305 [Emticicia aquatica]
MANNYNVFISHSWSYVEDLKKLRTALNERGYFNVEFMEHSPNEPINSENSTYVKQRLKRAILNSNIVLGIAGMYASHSEWIEWELETAKLNAIPIVGVIPKGQIRVSQVVSSRSIVDVDFITERIVEAIRKYAK